MRKSITLLNAFLAFSFLSAQSITGIIIPGATTSNSGSTWDVTFYSSTTSNTAKDNYREIKLIQNNTKGEYIVFDAVSGASDWEIVQGQPGSGSWFSFCKPMLENSNNCSGTCTTSYYVRNLGNAAGEFTATIKIGLSTATGGNKGSQCTYNSSTAITVNATVNKVATTGIYTWSEPTSGSDSSYKIAGNWTPTRTNPNGNDVLVVDLAQNNTLRNTTIYMDGVNESISQFKIFPYNHVTFKCSTSSNSAIWNIGSASSGSGHDFLVDTLAGMRIAGGTITSQITSGNTALFRSNLTIASGEYSLTGQGSHTFHKDIHIPGGALNFKPSSGSNTLYLKGTNTKISGTGGTLYIDSNMNIEIGNGTTSTYTLQRVLPVLSNLTLRPNTTLISNSPSNNDYSTSASVNNFTPFLQLKSTAKSNSSAHGQIMQIPATSSITGGALFELYNNKQRAYRALGLPFSNGVIIPQFTDDIDVTGTVSGSNANEFTTSCSFCSHSLFYWNEPTEGWVPYSSGNTVTNIPLGTGMLMFFRGAKGNGLGDTTVVANDKVITFKGELAQGYKSFNLTNSGNNANLSLEGYNLIGNPYPCTIDLRQVYESNKGSLLPRFYMYDAIARRYNLWDSVSPQGGNPNRNGTTKFSNAQSKNQARLLAGGGAAYFVVKNNPDSLKIKFVEAHKFSGLRSATKHFSSGVQEETTIDCNTLQADLSFTDKSNPENDGFTIEFDNSNFSSDGDVLDASKLYAYLAFGTVTANNRWLTIDRRDKIANPGESKSIPLKVAYPKDAPTAMEISFNYCASGNYRYDVQLVDKFKQTSTPVTEGTTYAFNASNADEKKSDRFELVFTGREQSSTSDFQKTNFTVYPNPTDNNLNILDPNHQISNIEVVNQFGQTQFTQNAQKGNNIHNVNLESLSNGLYFINITHKDGKETQKIIKY
jgi:hypothetical protein